VTGSGSGLGAATARMIHRRRRQSCAGRLESGDAPIGATCARLMVTLIHALRSRGLKRGIGSLCLGGGEATAVAIEVD
jgi:acetyl-CoA acetyltransferase